MKNYFALIASLLIFISVFSQKECTLESYYTNPTIFNEYETYDEVLIDGKRFRIAIISDALDNYMNPYPIAEYDYDDYAPKTILFYDLETNALVYAEKFDGSNPTFRKPNGEFNEAGKVYLSWFSSGGGSGYTVSDYLISLDDENNIRFSYLYDFGELSYLLFNKNDQEILMLSGIWGMDEEETHFSDHHYDIYRITHSDNGLEKEHLGTTKNKYPSGDEELPSTELLQRMYKGESMLFPMDFRTTDYKSR